VRCQPGALTATRERSNKLRRWFEPLIENQDDPVKPMTLEQGKPLAEAKGEIVYAASLLLSGLPKKPRVLAT
jgi:succinate-semialdehyde dehydrogenase/glutarate-semialdehyde dehydrogenase